VLVGELRTDNFALHFDRVNDPRGSFLLL